MEITMSKLKLAGLATLFAFAVAPLSAEQVTLNSLDGTVSMTGDLIEFDGLTYRILLNVGEISIAASQVVCEGAGCPNMLAGATEFSISGSSSVAANLLPNLIEVFALERGGDLDVSISADGSPIYSVLEPDGSLFAAITVDAGDSLSGFSGLLEGSAAIGISSRAASGNEVVAFELSGAGNLEQARIVALDGVIAAVNRTNTVSTLSMAQIAGVFDGSISNWRQVGGDDAPISLYRRAESAGTAAKINAIALEPAGRSFSAEATILASDRDVSDAISADVNGIGITSYAQERSARAVTIRSVCGQLFEPSEFSIKTEEYPLSQRIYFYTRSGALPDVAGEFLDFVTSASAQSVVSNAGFVDQSVGRATLDNQGRRMAQAIVSGSGRTELLQLQDLTANLLDAERLSFTLRLDASGNMDARAVADIDRIAAMIKAGDFSSRQILIFGFSDNTGGVNEQLNVTQDSAQAAHDAIVSATGRANLGNVRISPIGYGRLLPLGCNETSFGRTSNNRVEIWVK